MPDSPAPPRLPGSELRREIRALTVEVTAELLAVRRDIHAHPELSREEHRTTALVAERLAAANIPVSLLPGTGLIADFGPDNPGASRFALRADLDALPVADLTLTPWTSRVEGVAHACGHDVHTVCVLGAGLVLAELDRRGKLPLPLRLVFQPAEEVQPSGARDVIVQGGLEGVGAIVALHCDPRYDAGTVATRPGAITSASDLVTIYAYGEGGHTSRPHLTQDLVFATGQLLVQVPAVLDRLLDPRAGANLTWGAVHAGSVHNVIPASAVIEGTLRILDERAWEEAGQVLAQAVADIARPYGVRVEVAHQRGVPPVTNDDHMAALIAGVGRAMLGERGVGIAEQSLGGEDFAWYLRHVPGALMRLGTRRPGGPTFDLHQGDFDVDEGAIPVGVQVLAATALAARL
ncbi:MAG: amidohydrolase [Bifidobacteriaceae bacterium]|nr:amidohydrolase [Bifidobacteriaceae bacterium]